MMNCFCQIQALKSYHCQRFLSRWDHRALGKRYAQYHRLVHFERQPQALLEGRGGVGLRDLFARRFALSPANNREPRILDLTETAPCRG